MPEETSRMSQMESNARQACLDRVVDLDAKTLACDPLPDVECETDLNTFITQWKETQSPDLNSAI